MTPRVKICGIIRPRDADLAIELGATHLGCVVAADSPRCAAPADVDRIRERCRGRATFVLVLRGQDAAEVRTLTARHRPDLVQWHGAAPDDETLLARELPLLRVRRVPAGATALPDTSIATAERPVLLDGGRGGAGVSFDWSLLRGNAPTATFVAGGITPASLRDLVRHAPWGIDVGSGVELRPGVKDPRALSALFATLEVAR